MDSETWILPRGGRYRLLGWAIVLALAFRLYLLWQYYCISSDGVHYIDAARDFFAGRLAVGLSSVYPPVYPILIASIYPLIGDWELSGQIWSILSGVLLLIPLYVLFRRIYGENVALAACFLAAIAPYLGRYSVHVRTESPFLLLSTIALVLFDQGMARRLWGRFFYGGLVAGLAYLVRPEAIGFLVVVPLTLGVRCWIQKNRGLRWSAGACLFLLLGFFLLTFPYIFYLSVDTGQWGTISRKAGVTLGVSLTESGLIGNEELTDISGPGSLDITQFATHHPFLYMKKVLLDLIPSVGVYLEALHYSYIPFLFVGLFLFIRQRFWQREDLFLFVFLLFYLVGFALVYVNRRYAVQLLPVSLGWTAWGMIWCWAYLKEFLSLRAFRVVSSALAALFLAGTLLKGLKPISSEKAYVREAGWYLKEIKGSGNLNLLVFDDRIAFYANARPILLSELGEQELLGYLEDGEADYLVTEVGSWKERFPAVADDPELYGLVLQREFRGSVRSGLVVFRVNQRGRDGHAG